MVNASYHVVVHKIYESDGVTIKGFRARVFYMNARPGRSSQVYLGLTLETEIAATQNATAFVARRKGVVSKITPAPRNTNEKA